MQNAKIENEAQCTTDAVVVYTTLPSEAVARDVGGLLIGTRLAACVNIGAPVTSIYHWEGAIETAVEWPMIIKTRAGLAGAVTEALRAAKYYENPAVVVLPVIGGSADYLAWVVRETRDPAD